MTVHNLITFLCSPVIWSRAWCQCTFNCYCRRLHGTSTQGMRLLYVRLIPIHVCFRLLVRQCSQTMHALKNMFLFIMTMAFVVLYFVWSSQGREVHGRTNHEEKIFLCQMSYEDVRNIVQSESLPTIYFITPTYPRREQAAELTRLGQTLMHVPNLHWIVADDNQACNMMVTKLLQKFGIPFTHIASPMPEVYRKADTVPRGVANRRAALNWIRKNIKNGVFYFGDDDNTFDLELFEEIRDTKKVSMFPVGLIGDYAVSAPVLKEGKVIGFFDSWPSKRKFPVDMAGFAVNIELLLGHPNATMPYKAGYEEDQFLRSLGLTIDDIEPKGNSCTKVLVWHTQTSKKPVPVIKFQSLPDNSLKELLDELHSLGMADYSRSKGVTSYLTKDGVTHKV